MNIYKHMQDAVDIVQTSAHPTNKIAATIAGKTADNKDFAISRVNHWPEIIAEKIGTEPDIGNSSGTVHAETACILAAPRTKDASIFITDPPCPNCMKNMAEAGISKLYIDHKGFDKDWAKRRGDSFENMSMRIAAKAGINVYVIYRKEERFEIISRHPPGYKPSIENPPRIESTNKSFESLIEELQNHQKDEPFACALTTCGKYILVDRHPTVGYTYETVESKQDKYSFIMQPLSRLLMIAAREGLKLEPKHIYSSRVPTSREFVNLIGAGFRHIQIGDTNKARDEHGPKALQQLIHAEILNVQD